MNINDPLGLITGDNRFLPEEKRPAPQNGDLFIEHMFLDFGRRRESDGDGKPEKGT